MKLFFFFSLSHLLLIQQDGIGFCAAGAAKKTATQEHTSSSSRLGYTTSSTSRQLQPQGQGGGGNQGGGGGGGGGPKTFETSGLSVQILGQSGKFIASNGNSKVQVTMDGLYERDENGNLVGNTGSTKHSINTFATTDFTFDAEETVQLLEVTNDDGNVTQQQVSAEGLRVDFYTTLDTNSKLLVQANLVSKEGLAGDDGGNWTVSPGDFKFNIELSDWEWCDPCSNDQYGAFVDLDIEIKELNSDSSGNHQPVLKRDRNQTFDLGGDGSSAATLELSHKFMVKKGTSSGGAGSANMVSFMPEGYPKVTKSGEKTLFTFRFSKFDKDSTAKYDPIIKFSSTSDSSSAASITATSGKVFGGMLGLVSGLLTYYNVFFID